MVSKICSVFAFMLLAFGGDLRAQDSSAHGDSASAVIDPVRKRDRYPTIAVGAGGHFGRLRQESTVPGALGPLWMIELGLPFDSDRRWNLDIGFFKWYKFYREGESLRQTTSEIGFSLLMRYCFLSPDSDVRPSLSFGGAPVLFLTYDIGAAVDIAVIQDRAYLQISARHRDYVIRRGPFKTIRPGDYFPTIVSVAFRLRL